VEEDGQRGSSRSGGRRTHNLPRGVVAERGGARLQLEVPQGGHLTTIVNSSILLPGRWVRYTQGTVCRLIAQLYSEKVFDDLARREKGLGAHELRDFVYSVFLRKVRLGSYRCSSAEGRRTHGSKTAAGA
jgi:hypothetical protein